MDEKKVNSTNKLLIILVVLLSLLVGGFGGYIVFSNISKNDSKNFNKIEGEAVKEETKEVIKELSLDDPLVKGLSDRVIGIFTSNFSSDYNDYFYKKDKIILNEESLRFKMALSTYKLTSDALNNSNISNVTLNEGEVKSAYESLFGKNNGYKTETFTSGFCNVEFEYVNGIYDSHTYGGGGCGGISVNASSSKLAYAKHVTSSNLDKIEIYEYFYYEVGPESVYNEDNNLKIYSDYNRTNLIVAYDDYNLKNDIYEKYKDKLGQYKYTFVKNNDGVYVFTSVEKVK